MSKQTCWSCGTAYEGSACPVCAMKKALQRQTEEVERLHAEDARERERHAEELSRRIEESNAEAAFEMEVALDGALHEQKRIVSEGWMHRSRSKSDRAHELLRGGMYDQAILLARQAAGEVGAEGDPSNMDAYTALAWSLEAKGLDAEARRYYEAQVSLLGTTRYGGDPATFYTILVGLPDDASLLASFSRALRAGAGGWNPRTLAPLISTLCGRGLEAEARLLGERAVAGAAALRGDYTVLDTLIGHELFVEAMRLIDALAAQGDSLQLHARRLEVGARSGRETQDGLAVYVKGFDAARRGALASEFAALDKERFSEGVVERIRDRVRDRVAELRPDIEREIFERATASTKKAKAGWPFGCLFGIVSYMGLGMLTMWLSTEVVNGGYTTPRAQGLIPGLAFISIAGCVWASFIFRRLRVTPLARAEVERLEQAESETWRPFGPLEIRAPRPRSSGALVQLFVLVGIVALYLIGGYVYVTVAGAP